MFIKSFGLFWSADEVEWNPGSGGKFRLLGHSGKNIPGVRVADFRNQLGIYILYRSTGAYYVGLTKKQGIGTRLKQHLEDDHKGKWDRFSWFGFCAVLKGKDDDGLCKLAHMAQIAVGNPTSVITDVEALLIRAMGLPAGTAVPRFTNAEEWEQIKAHETEHFMSKIAWRFGDSFSGGYLKVPPEEKYASHP